MNDEQLKTFISLMNTKNFTRTAEELNIVQSTVTTRIKMLEDSIGEKLFHRGTRSVEATPAGTAFVSYAERSLEWMREGMEAARIQGKYKDRLVIAGLQSIWDGPVFDLVHSYYGMNEQTAFRIITDHSQAIIDRLHQGLAHIGFVYTKPRSSAYRTWLFSEESLHLVAAPSVATTVKDFVTAGDILDNPYLHYNWGSDFTEWFEKEIGQEDAMRLRVDNTNTALRLLLKGAGLAFLPSSIAEPYFKEGALTSIPFTSKTSLPGRTIYLIYSADKEEKLRPFLEHLKLV